jgi:DNA polymerase I-like protein with 3'-5' exonuclease and polymerase domains/uracil-DNA glycosylase
MLLGAKCRQCPLYNRNEGPVMGQIRPRAKLAVVGEAPSSRDVEEGAPFVGQHGEILAGSFAEGGVTKSDCTLTHAILCRPPGGSLIQYLVEFRRQQRKLDPAQRQLDPREACFPRLQMELAANDEARTVLGLGNEGLRAVARIYDVPFGSAKAAPGAARLSTVTKQHGSPLQIVRPSGRDLTVMASLQPSFALHGKPEYMPVVRADLTRTAEISQRGGQTLWREPEFILEPTLDVAINLLDALRLSKQLVTIDIETDSVSLLKAAVRCVGIGAEINGHEIIGVIPLEHMQSRLPWWGPGAMTQIQNAIRALMDEAPLNGHNLIFDTAVMLCRGLMTRRDKLWMDTLIGHHDTRWSELPHNLGFVSARLFDSPRWKEDADSKVVKGVADYWLHKYCAKDVLGEHRLAPLIAAQVQADGQLGAYSTDIRMAPGLRDMGLLGLNINEQRRQEYFHTFTRAALKHRENVRAIVGNPTFNPSAARQVARFLFDEQGLTPTYASGGLEWEELIQENEDEELDLDLEDLETVVVKASTDETALLALIERGVDAKSRNFIDAELSFRAMLKTHTALGLKLESDGAQTDTYRAKGHLHTRSFDGPGLQGLSILNPNWKVHVTPSGRLASSPAVQNIAERVVHDVEAYRRTEGKQGLINLRTIFEAPPGYIYVGADYSQIELRLVAAKAKDRLLLEALAKGLDPHALNYATMMARNEADIMREYERVVTAPPKIKKHLRNISKRLAFLIFYGGHKTKLAKTMKSDRNPDGSLSFPDLKDSDVFFWYDNFHKQHPEILRWQQETIAYWQVNGFVETVLDGRRRYFVGGEDMTAIPNMRIQGSAAAIANRALLLLMRDCPYQGWGELAGPVFQCHDELVLQVPIERTKDAENLIHEHLPWTDPADGMYYAIEQSTRKTLAGG